MRKAALTRRTMLAASAAAALPLPALAYPAIRYAPDTWRSMRDTDQTIIMNFRATWSLTCQMKADILAQLLEETPAYQRLTFLEVDWDTFGEAVLTNRLKVEQRSTLLVMKGGKEVARLVNTPEHRAVRALLDQALAA